MQNLAQYVRVYDDVFEKEYCDDLIKLYDESLKTESPFYRRSDHRWEQDYRGFGELAITQAPGFQPYIKTYYETVARVYAHYKDIVDNEFFPDTYAFEDCRMKKYEPDGHDQFGWHVDVGDKASSSRIIAVLTYLNDIPEGEGATKFKSNVDFTVNPKCGRIVVFPASFLYPHIGEKVVTEAKYIISSYIHYV